MISTTSSRAPRRSAESTPGICSIAVSAWRASCSSVRSGTSPPSATTSTGKSERLTSWTCGSSASRGSSLLRVVDLGAHVGERHVGIEAGLELEQHVAAALEGGGAHLLDVVDRLQLRLERAQDQPLGILRARCRAA